MMKNQKGITLISLIVYVILMTFVVAGVSAITTSFYNNVNDMDENSESAVSFAQFNMYFLNDIKAENAKIVGATNHSLELTKKAQNGTTTVVTYSVQAGTLYRDKVKICNNIKESKIDVNKEQGIITIYLKINDYEKTTTYVVEPKTKDASQTTV